MIECDFMLLETRMRVSTRRCPHTNDYRVLTKAGRGDRISDLYFLAFHHANQDPLAFEIKRCDLFQLCGYVKLVRSTNQSSCKLISYIDVTQIRLEIRVCASDGFNRTSEQS